MKGATRGLLGGVLGVLSVLAAVFIGILLATLTHR